MSLVKDKIFIVVVISDLWLGSMPSVDGNSIEMSAMDGAAATADIAKRHSVNNGDAVETHPADPISKDPEQNGYADGSVTDTDKRRHSHHRRHKCSCCPSLASGCRECLVDIDNFKEEVREKCADFNCKQCMGSWCSLENVKKKLPIMTWLPKYRSVYYTI